MPKAAFAVSTIIHATPERVFSYASDLTRHGEWSANQLTIEPLAPGRPAAKSRYRSTAVVNGITFNAELEVKELAPPDRFVFAGQDATGRFQHTFTFRAVRGGTNVERRVDFDLSVRQWLMFWVLLYPVRLPAARRSLESLKLRLEQSATS
jgi:uncharacterized protein YndB with AHSA1/START domain